MKTPSPEVTTLSPVVVKVDASPVNMNIGGSNGCQGTNASLANSAAHLKNYRHIHIVKRPSLLEDSSMMANL